MKFYKELIAESSASDKEKIAEITGSILSCMDDCGIRYLNDDFEKVADNHIIELARRINEGKLLKDDEMQYDRSQVPDQAWQKASEVADCISRKYHVQMSGVETFLIATHFALNEGGKS